MNYKEAIEKKAICLYERLSTENYNSVLNEFPKGINFMPFNFATKKMYQGNSFLMDMFADNRFVTFNQLKERKQDEYIKKGAKAIPIFIPMIGKSDDNDDVTIKKEIDILGNGEKLEPSIIDGLKITNQSKAKYYKVSFVFNIQDVENCKEESLKDYIHRIGVSHPITLEDKHKTIDSLIERMKVEIDHNADSRYFYMPKQNKIRLQFKEMYQDVNEYYKTLLHEVSHWSRNNLKGLERNLSKEELAPKKHLENMFDKHKDFKYVREEFCAELSSYYLNKYFCLGNEKTTNKYLKMYMNYNPEFSKEDWIDIIKDAIEAAEKTKKLFIKYEKESNLAIEFQKDFIDELSPSTHDDFGNTKKSFIDIAKSIINTESNENKESSITL
jgi:antirestriction protein ArdC